MLVHGPGVPDARRAALEARGVALVEIALDGAGRPDAATAAARLFTEHGIRRVLLEGGPTLAASWLEAGLVDQVMAFVAPKILGGGAAPGPVGGRGLGTVALPLPLADSTTRRIGRDLLIEGFLGTTGESGR